MATTVANGLQWSNRKPEEFIESLITSNQVYTNFTLISGVKSTADIPKYDATIAFHSDLCSFDPQASIDVDEKQMAVGDFKWDFSDCKGVLETTWRSELLRKGVNNAEVIDSELADWAYDRFSKLVSEKLLTEAATQIQDKIENGPEAADVNTVIHTAPLTSATILDKMEELYTAAPEVLVEAMLGSATDTYRPVYMMNANMVRLYKLATKDLNVSFDREDQTTFPTPTFLGLDIVLFPKLADNTIILAEPTNFVMLVDDMDDPSAIMSEYTPKTNSLDVWGQFRVGYDFKRGQEIVYASANITS